MNPTAIILGMYGMNALGMLRSLAIEKIPTKMYHIRGKFPTAKYSKHANYFKIEKNKEALLERLLKDGVQQEDKGIIFATEDEHVLFCSENYEELEKYYDVPKIIGKEMIDCLNKKNILQFGVAAGFNVPKTYTLSEFSGQIDAPIVVKPINSLKYGKSATGIYRRLSEKKHRRTML
jgi:predicted ATP-grasp superfamily ATP-dependent carboligase